MAKNILYITDTGRVLGGGEISLINLLENLDKGRFRAVACVPDEGDASGRIRALGIPVHLFAYRKISNPFNFFATIRSIRALCAIIEKENIDLVHTNATGGIVVLAGIACRMKKRPLVSHIRLIYSGFFQDIAQGLLSTKIIMISCRIGRKMSFKFFQRKLSLVYNGVNMARFRQDAARIDLRKDLDIPENAFVCGAAGAYVPGKGFEYLIKAAGILQDAIAGMRMIIVGFQPDERMQYVRTLKDMAEKAGLGRTIRFLGKCEDMAAFFKAIDVFVFPSLIDPFGRVLIEAMASAKPVVSFDTGGAPEIIADGKTGWLVRPRDHKALAAKISSFQNRDTARQFGIAGYERCRQMFDIAMHAQAVQRIYAEVLRDGSCGYILCPICATDDCAVINTCRISPQDAVIEEKTVSLCRCRHCGLVYVNPQPKVLERRPQELYTQEYFQKGYMRFYAEDQGATQSNEPFLFRLNLINGYKKSGDLLDIGCASGEFLKACRDRGFRVTGIDISSYAARVAKEKHGIDVRRGELHDAHFAQCSFDVVTAGDVLEHIRDPRAFLTEIHRILKPDGILYLAMPDFSSLHYRVMSMIAHFNHKNYFVLPHHIFHFTPQTLEKLLHEAGFMKLKLLSTESSIQEQGARRLFMQMLFGAARIFNMKDRIVMLAAKIKEGPSAQL